MVFALKQYNKLLQGKDPDNNCKFFHFFLLTTLNKVGLIMKTR